MKTLDRALPDRMTVLASITLFLETSFEEFLWTAVVTQLAEWGGWVRGWPAGGMCSVGGGGGSALLIQNRLRFVSSSGWPPLRDVRGGTKISVFTSFKDVAGSRCFAWCPGLLIL